LDTNPSYSFGLKLEEKIKSFAPAPGIYDIEKADDYLDLDPSYSFGLRPERKINSVAPAPATYDIEKADKIIDSNPAYSFGLRIDEKINSISPGPNAYRPEDCKDEPKAPTMHIKPKDPKSFVTRSFGKVITELAEKDVKLAAPKYSFGIKSKDSKSIPGPAPNAYSLGKAMETLHSMPSKSFGIIYSREN
jgi:hypothetical protein